MIKPCRLQGRAFEASHLNQVRELLGAHPEWSRYRLSRELCTLWQWHNGVGQPKDMAARTLLNKLAQRGWIELPAARQASPNRHRLAAPPRRTWDQSPITQHRRDLEPLCVNEVSQHASARAELRAALDTFHYLGYRLPVGENLQYTVRDAQQRLLAVLVFGAAAWKCAPRDEWIGWTPAQRENGLARIANNSRFLILPWVTVPCLASWILGRVARRVADDWAAKYGHTIQWLESFVERDRFQGTCYRAANWRAVGFTQGRSRQDRHGTLRVPIKEVYLYPLRADFRKELQ